MKENCPDQKVYISYRQIETVIHVSYTVKKYGRMNKDEENQFHSRYVNVLYFSK